MRLIKYKGEECSQRIGGAKVVPNAEYIVDDQTANVLLASENWIELGDITEPAQPESEDNDNGSD